jgi:hypothetical protein
LSTPERPSEKYQYLLRNFGKQQLRQLMQRKNEFLALACKNNLVEIVRYLANDCGVDINMGNPTPFWHASNGGYEEEVKILVKKEGLDFEKKAPDGTSPLNMIIVKGHSQLIQHLLQLYHDDGFPIMKVCIQFGRTDTERHRRKIQTRW